jgi:hypothetical protein
MKLLAADMAAERVQALRADRAVMVAARQLIRPQQVKRFIQRVTPAAPLATFSRLAAAAAMPAQAVQALHQQQAVQVETVSR